jgi:hypothetical protein
MKRINDHGIEIPKQVKDPKKQSQLRSQPDEIAIRIGSGNDIDL